MLAARGEIDPSGADGFAATWLSRPYSVHRSTTDVDSPDLTEVVPTLDVPTLVMVGGDSPSKPVEEARWLSAHLPRGAFATIPGTRHFGLFEDPACVAERIEEFLVEALR